MEEKNHVFGRSGFWRWFSTRILLSSWRRGNSRDQAACYHCLSPSAHPVPRGIIPLWIPRICFHCSQSRTQAFLTLVLALYPRFADCRRNWKEFHSSCVARASMVSVLVVSKRRFIPSLIPQQQTHVHRIRTPLKKNPQLFQWGSGGPVLVIPDTGHPRKPDADTVRCVDPLIRELCPCYLPNGLFLKINHVPASILIKTADRSFPLIFLEFFVWGFRIDKCKKKEQEKKIFITVWWKKSK